MGGQAARFALVQISNDNIFNESGKINFASNYLVVDNELQTANVEFVIEQTESMTSKGLAVNPYGSIVGSFDQSNANETVILNVRLTGSYSGLYQSAPTPISYIGTYAPNDIYLDPVEL